MLYMLYIYFFCNSFEKWKFQQKLAINRKLIKLEE